jgi:transcriptional regulator with XRE-family HTH domain
MRKLITFEEWEAERMQDPAFVAAVEAHEPAYQIARLRILRGLTQAELANEVGTAQPNIARLESGAKDPCVSNLRKIAEALDADLVIRFVPREHASGGAAA